MSTSGVTELLLSLSRQYDQYHFGVMKMKNVLLGLTTAAVLLAMQPVAGTSESHAQEMTGEKSIFVILNDQLMNHESKKHI
jgi:hypothetical protein